MTKTERAVARAKSKAARIKAEMARRKRLGLEVPDKMARLERMLTKFAARAEG